MTRSIQISLCAAFVCCAVAIALAAKINSDLDKTADFSSYKTFAWGKNIDPPRAGANFYISGAVEHELEARGLQPATDIQHADLIIRYEAAGDTDINLAGITDPMYDTTGGVAPIGATPWSSGLSSGLVGRYVRKGTLVIDIFDAQQHKLIWRTSAIGAVSDSTTKAAKQLNGIIAEMFRRYPVKDRT